MEELEDADEWTTLSMLQAITLYVLLRIFDQDSFSVDFDVELVRTMTVRYPSPQERINDLEKLNSSFAENRDPSRATAIALPGRGGRLATGLEGMGVAGIKAKVASFCSTIC
jgi:hypothetical protein